MKIDCAHDKMLPLEQIQPNPRNYNKHPEKQIKMLSKIIDYQGQRSPIVISKRSGFIVKGHGRLQAIKMLGWEQAAVDYQDYESEAQEYADMIADNKIAELADPDDELMKDIIRASEIDDFELFGLDDFSLDGLEKDEPDVEHISLVDKYVVPPFSILDARQGYWMERKRYWNSKGIASKEGRDENLMRAPVQREYADNGTEHFVQSTSVFDPVLCEALYRWYCREGGHILDPFAGGSVRGLVAGLMGYRYTGVDIRDEQVVANRAQRERMEIPDQQIEWIHGDSRSLPSFFTDTVDFVMSCPPYGDLEVYSDLPGDISTMDYDDFMEVYREIIMHSTSLLSDDSFAAFVVGEIRDKAGIYRDFVGDTVQAFRDAGLSYYNEAILATPVGTGAMRADRFMSSSRKLIKMHQNVLVFVKGDPKKATEKVL